MRGTRMLAAAMTAAALAIVPATAPASSRSRIPGKVLKHVQVTFVNGTVLKVYASRVVHGSTATLYFTEYGHAKGKPFAYVARMKVPRPFYPDSQIYDFRLTRPPPCAGCTRFNAGGAISWYLHADRASSETHYWGASLHGQKLQWYS